MASEIANLHLTFAYAYVTITASRASHRREGSLYPTPQPLQAGIGFEVPFTCPDSRVGSVILYKGDICNPVDDRAWTFAEFMLSRRILAYTTEHFR